MKVYISGYPDNHWRCRIHDRYMDKKYDYDWKESTTKKEKFLEKLESVIQFIYNVTINQIVKYRKRRIWVHIDREDTWSMDHTLAHIILPMLKQLKDTKHGAPFVDDEDVPEELRSTAAEPKENEWDTDSNHFKRWDWVMDEMIYAFSMEVKDDWDMELWIKNKEKWTPEAMEKRRAIQARIANGFRLFGKYYQGLWD